MLLMNEPIQKLYDRYLNEPIDFAAAARDLQKMHQDHPELARAIEDDGVQTNEPPRITFTPAGPQPG